MLPDPITELTIAMEIDYFQLNRAEYFVPIVVKIPGRELALAKRGGAERTLIDFIGEIKDEYGTTITNVRDKVNIKLSEATAANWRSARSSTTPASPCCPENTPSSSWRATTKRAVSEPIKPRSSFRI